MNGISKNGNSSGRLPRVFVAGALGAVGSLVADLLRNHPRIELAALTSRETGDDQSPIGKTLREIYPEHRVDLKLQTLEELNLSEFDAAVIAYPMGVAGHLAKQLLDAGLVVIDSCADSRFSDVNTYEEWYGPHPEPSLLKEAVYGLPELNRDEIIGAKLIGNPGCYPTASVIGLAPLVREGLIEDVVIDAKSGVSGAGKRGDATPSFVGTHDNMRPYGIPRHRHEPEIAEKLGELGYHGNISFVPHLIPIDQGELVSCYVAPTREIDADSLMELYENAYGPEPFVEVSADLPSTRDVQRTNICRVHPMLDHDKTRIFVFVTIDNLWKGGASQAVQNLNLALGMPEGEGISDGIDSSPPSGRAASLDRIVVSA